MVSAARPDVLDYIGRRHAMLIGDERLPVGGDGEIAVLDPSTEEVVAHVPAADGADVDRAVAVARRAFADGRWHALLPDDRRAILWRFADLIEARRHELAQIEVIDNGMPMAFAEWEVNSCVSWLRNAAGVTTQLFGRNASAALSGGGTAIHAYTRVEPVGVVGLIVPWNAPAGNLIIKLGLALAAGCSCVIKPAEDTPLAALWLAERALEAGLPPGVMNVVTGYGRVAGQALVDHGGIDKISFTGSTATGKHIARCAADNLKRLTLELGGKSPVIVLDDADLDSAIPQVAMAIFANTGQVCFAGSRLYVQRKAYDKVVAGVADFAASLKLGSGFDPVNLLGPVISARQRDRVYGYIERGREQGGELLCGGTRIDGKGYFVAPAIFANVARNADIAREEIFGPVLVATPFNDLADAIAIANDTRYGLGAGVFTTNVNQAHLIAGKLETGNVWVNCYGTTHPAMPFGGFKESGWGHEMGAEGLLAFQKIKSVFVKLNDEERREVGDDVA